MLIGLDDSVVQPSMLEGLEDHADDFSIERVEGCGHFIAEEKPELVAARALQLALH